MSIVSIILKYPLQKMKFPKGGQLCFLGMYIQECFLSLSVKDEIPILFTITIH